MTLSKDRGDSNKRLWMRLCVELGAAPITEAYIQATDTDFIEGFCETRTGSITIAPHTNVVNTLIHELLHRMYPTRSEKSIRRSTTLLMQTLTDQEIKWFYDEYQVRKKLGKPTKL